jgi:N-methylhydantoinase B
VRTRCDRLKRPPWGVLGGGDARPGEVSLTTNGITTALPGKSTLGVSSGDRVHTQWCGGGGYGDPLERDPGLILDDVIAQKISPDRARDVYGVVVDVANRRVDHAATEACRRQRGTPNTS